MLAGVFIGLLAMTGTAASATSYGETETVSCDGNTIKSLANIYHNSNSSVTFRQRDTSPGSASYVFLQGSTGNQTSTKTFYDGSIKSWSGVLKGSYVVRAYRTSAYNCNGAWAGHGNYSLKYTVSY